ncbi:MAG: neuraminidase-like domain-containing protein, partial [Steroidobacteraceae bacterium]
MADYIVIRLVPPTPVDPATFGTYLSGLRLQVYDASYAHPLAGTPGDPTPPFGTAQYQDPILESLPALYPGGAPYVTYAPGTGIVQHFDLELNSAGTEVVAVNFVSVATAVIAVSPGLPEYVTSDIRAAIVRPAAQTVFDGNVYYDVSVYSGAAPAPEEYPALSAGSYLTLPAITDPNLASLQVPSDGSAPNYDALITAINKVVVKDPATDPDLASLIAAAGPLSVSQARNIAYEIVWGSQPALPVANDSLENMYTDPPNSGTSANSYEQSRQQFEGGLSSFYSTRDAQAEQLTKFVFSASAAIWCELQTQSATSAYWLFPTNPNGSSALATVMTADVVLTGTPGSLTITVPAAYFYALTALIPVQISPAQRLQTTCGANEQQNLTQLIAAVDGNVITLPGGAPDPSQAVRMLNALAAPGTSVTQCPVSLIQPLWSDWLAWTPADWRQYQAGDELEEFWPTEVAKPAPVPNAFLELVLYALTDGYVISGSLPPMLLADDIKANLIVHGTDGSLLFSGVDTVGELAQALQSDWQAFFDGSPLPPPLTASMRANLLPPFTNPGGVTAFIQYVRKFFDMPTPTPVFGSGGGAAPSSLDLPTVDWIEACLTAYGPFIFGTPLTAADLLNLQAAAASVFPGDTQAQQWVVQIIVTINELTICAVIAGTSAAQQFSIAEALFARGFTGFDSILDRPLDNFQQALTGTVAYDYAATIYANAGAPHTFPTTGIGPFGPINDGTLRNCIPPRYLSPLGPIEYLHEMLQVSEASTCSSPAAPPTPGHTTLEGALDPRRGPLGSLLVTDANLSTPIPLIDIVNESLEFMASTMPPTAHGTIYNTAGDVVVDHRLCAEPCCEPGERHPGCHKPADLFAALPQFSTPAVPVADNAAVEPAVYNVLKNTFSSCCLPYSQAIDLSETYLKFFGSCRFEELRSFRRCITEFVLDPVNEPSGFQSHLWRYPVRIDTAIAYLGITPEEYVTLFQGPWPASCAAPTSRIGTEFDAPPPTWTLYGFENQTQNQQSWIDITLRLPQFLRRLCLTYCEFLELWRCGYVAFSNGAAADGKFPVCEPCCLDDLWLKFPATPGAAQALFEIYLFVRLHRKLQDVCGARYSFVELADICSVLQLFPANVLNPDFIRQLAAFQMLRDRFKLPLVDKKNPAPTGSGAERTALLALWAGPGAAKWDWALHQLLHGVAHHACRHEHRSPEFIKLLVSNLDPLSRLAGFNPSISSDAWDALPTHTLRFAEVLAKIYASSFGVGELLYLFTADPQLDGNEPFPLQYDDEALDYPLGIPDDEHAHSLARLRRELLDAESREHAWQEWEWPRVAGFLVNELGIARASVQALGEHLFPGILRAAGVAVPPADVRYAVDLDPAQTVPQMWATQPGAPFEFDLLSATAGQLSTRTPLRDTAVIEQLTHLRPLQLAERIAVQSLYWQPRADLAQFAAVFTDLPDAEHHLIEEEGETRRWEYFRRHAVLCHERCQILARHLAKHVSDVTGDPLDDGVRQAALILKQLFADENRATADWQGSDAGSVPPVTWSPPPAGGAWAALLGLSGTGLVREYSIDGSGVVWRDVSGALAGFGTARNEHNCPVPTVIPALDLALDPQQLQFASVLNGIGIRDSNDEWLGGAQGFCVRWTGALLVDEDGLYEFCAGRPADHGLRPICDDHERARWRVELKRGQSTCVLLEHGHPAARVSTQRVELRRGAYDVHIRFEQLPLAGDEYVRRQHTGFQLKWKGPDTGDQLSEIPRSHLYCVSKNANLAAGIAPISSGAAAFLHNRYFSTLRDIRRTYQRAFKALVFAHRLRLSAHPGADHRGALEYLLSQPARFVGVSYYRAGGGFVRHAANFDFNFLPLLDNYYAPAAAQDSRVSPSLQREQALFDWWERLWDFGRAREEVFKRCERHLWRLCEEAAAIMPAHPQYLLRHMGADVRHWDLDTRFYQDQNNPVYVLTSADLSDDRWVIRAWHADLWIRGMQRCFTVKDITRARPDLWASLDPSALVSGETQTGNTNLSSVLGDGLLESGQPCRYADLQQLNDGLRERGRHALLAYLCGTTGIVHSPKALSELLLIDVETGLCERATRIDEAISAVQLFVQRARLGLEPGWVVTRNFASLWDARFASFHGWEVCKRRELYKENWIDWHELDRARKIESFQFLDGELRRATLTIATPGGVDYWPDERPPPHAALTLLQQRDPSTMKLLAAPREGLGLLGTPDAAGRPSWLAPVTDAAPTIAPPPSGNGLAPISVTAARARRTEQLPLWMEAAMRLGTRFIRVAAAAYPPAAMPFEPREDPAGHGPSERCVECCAECGCVHPRHMDEYYFWLVDASRYDASTQDSYYDYNLQQATPWEEEPSLSQLLQWPAQPIVRLAWCRVHNGNFHPPRRSVHGIEVPAGSTPLPDLLWAGRAADSLYFTVSNAATSTAPNPGFRYDIATDTAAAEGNLTVPAIPASEFPGALNAYPYFAYHHPGARLFPWSLFTPAVAVAEALRTHCKFEAALKWYALVYAPLDSDNTWVHCNAHASPPAGA